MPKTRLTDKIRHANIPEILEGKNKLVSMISINLALLVLVIIVDLLIVRDKRVFVLARS